MTGRLFDLDDTDPDGIRRAALLSIRSWHEGDEIDGPALLPYFDGEPCPMCGERYACGHDAEGRPMVHVLVLNEEGRAL